MDSTYTTFENLIESIVGKMDALSLIG